MTSHISPPPLSITMKLHAPILILLSLLHPPGVTSLSGEAACEDHGYTTSECAAIGCCQWDDDSCWSSVGTSTCPGTESESPDDASDSDSDAPPPCVIACLDSLSLPMSIPSTCLDIQNLQTCLSSSCSSAVISDLAGDLDPVKACLCSNDCPSDANTNNDGEPCLDAHAARLGVTGLPESAPDAYKALYCQYTAYIAPNGKPIEIFGQSALSSLQLHRAKSILGFYLEDFSCYALIDPSDTCFGLDKHAIANAMANNGAKLDMPNGAHEQPGAGQSLWGQELYESEVPVEGGVWFMTDDMDHRDAAFEEILHLVHDNGIGIDLPGYKTGAAPEFQAVIREVSCARELRVLSHPRPFGATSE